MNISTSKSKFLALFTLTLFAFFPQAWVCAKSYEVKSPDGRLEALVEDGDNLSISILSDGKVVMDKALIGMSASFGELGKNAKAISSKTLSNNTVIKNSFGIRSEVPDNYRQLELSFGKWSLIVRVYNEAVAYRFSANFGNGDAVIVDETLELPFASDTKIISHYMPKLMSAHEEFFSRDTIGGMRGKFSAMLPFLISLDGATLVVTESDVYSYPAMRMAYKNGKACGSLSKYPKKLKDTRFMALTTEVEDFAAKTKASRQFPWRVFIFARDDTELADSDTVFKLASPLALEDTSWIHPGTCLWDWWNCWNLEGVNFKSGVNEETYRYMIDFASTHGIPYILMDSGWLTGTDVAGMKDSIHEALINGKPFLDVPSIIAYAHSKDVKVVLWVLGRSIEKYCDKAFDLLASWGTDGVKVDFFDRDDQSAYELYERIAAAAAKRNMVVDFHGCAKPAGLNKKYPNVLNFEAVRGNEYNKFNPEGTPPSHNLDIIFTRMLQGPMDYTPGATRNVRKGEFRMSSNQPVAMGTRASQAAMYVLYYAPLQMLSDSATDYAKSPAFFKFIAGVPTVWDDTKVLEGKIGEYAVIARRKGENWYVAGMTDWTPRDVSLTLSKFLSPDTEYKAEIIRDGFNTDKLATDYRHEVVEVDSTGKLNFSMRSGGGFAVKFSPKKLSFFDDVVKFFTDED